MCGSDFLHSSGTLGWRFPWPFWVANMAELFERAAYYGMFIALSVYLTTKVGFSDVQTGYVGACFASVLYFLPTFMGALADRIGFRRALMLAFALLTVGYALLGTAGHPAWSGLAGKIVALVSLAIIIVGGATVKPVISGTVAKCSDADHRARAFSIFYTVVNIGAFLGKTVAKPLRTGFTIPGTNVYLELGLEYINYYAAAMALLALLFVAAFYRNIDRAGTSKTAYEIWEGLLEVICRFRFMALILIVAGFWALQGQLYATMPKYVLRLVGPQAAPEWLANINPAIVVLGVVPITHLVRRFKPENSIAIALFLISLSMFSISLSPSLAARAGQSVAVLGWFHLHPVTVMLVVGIALMGLAECFLSPKFLEYASKQAPPGEEGLYMGYQYLTSAFAWAFSFIFSGYLLQAFCPDPQTLDAAAQAQWRAALESGGGLPEVYTHAHYIWYAFTGVGLTAWVALLVFKFVTGRLERERGA